MEEKVQVTPEREWEIDAAEIMEGVTDDDAAAEAEAEAAAEGAGAAAEDNSGYTLRHLDDTVTVDRDRVVELAQKGLDYDRVREKLESARSELAELHDWLREVSGGRDEGEFRDALSVRTMAEREGITESEARGRMELERAKRVSGADTPGQRRRREAREFAEAYPEVAARLVRDASAIPDEVWRRVRAGESLLAAYENHRAKSGSEEKNARIRDLESELAGVRQAKTNAVRSTGSVDSDGGDAGADPVAAGWNAV